MKSAISKMCFSSSLFSGHSANGRLPGVRHASTSTAVGPWRAPKARTTTRRWSGWANPVGARALWAGLDLEGDPLSTQEGVEVHKPVDAAAVEEILLPVIRGEPGIGKSALLSEASGRAKDKVVTVQLSPARSRGGAADPEVRSR